MINIKKYTFCSWTKLCTIFSQFSVYCWSSSCPKESSDESNVKSGYSSNRGLQTLSMFLFNFLKLTSLSSCDFTWPWLNRSFARGTINSYFPFERCLTPSFLARGIMWAFKLKSCKQLLWNAVTTAIFGLMSATEDEGSSVLVWESEISSVSESANTQHLYQYWWHFIGNEL